MKVNNPFWSDPFVIILGCTGIFAGLLAGIITHKEKEPSPPLFIVTETIVDEYGEETVTSWYTNNNLKYFGARNSEFHYFKEWETGDKIVVKEDTYTREAVRDYYEPL